MPSPPVRTARMPNFGPTRPRRLAETGHLVLQHRLSRMPGGKRILGPVYGLSTRFCGRPGANWHRDDNNFGDQMAPFLFQAATGHVPFWVPGWYPGKILGLGSLIHRIKDGDVVWGTGAIMDAPVKPHEKARILAVRGPLTRKLLGADVPETYGDPALLLPRYYDEPQEEVYDVGVVPHFLDKPFMQLPSDGSISLIDVQMPWRTVVDNIRKCSCIISSSLHGLVVAEAYGVPAVWVSAGDRLTGGAFKFHDYYLGTGREPPAALAWKGRLPRQLLAPPSPQIDLEPLIAAAKSLVN
jgi:pyruvyltransferase